MSLAMPGTQERMCLFKWRVALKKTQPYSLMVLLQFGFAGLCLLYVFTLKHGLNHYLLIVYCNVIATLVILPLSLWLERYISITVLLIFLFFFFCCIFTILNTFNFYFLSQKYEANYDKRYLLEDIPASTIVIIFVSCFCC